MNLHQTPGPIIGLLLCLYRGDLPETSVRNVIISKLTSQRKNGKQWENGVSQVNILCRVRLFQK